MHEIQLLQSFPSYLDILHGFTIINISQSFQEANQYKNFAVKEIHKLQFCGSHYTLWIKAVLKTFRNHQIFRNQIQSPSLMLFLQTTRESVQNSWVQNSWVERFHCHEPQQEITANLIKQKK